MDSDLHWKAGWVDTRRHPKPRLCPAYYVVDEDDGQEAVWHWVGWWEVPGVEPETYDYQQGRYPGRYHPEPIVLRPWEPGDAGCVG